MVIGASAGGLEPAYAILAALPKDVPVVAALVVHRGAHGAPSVLANLVSRRAGRPAIDRLFVPAAEWYGVRVTGVLLWGVGATASSA